VVSDDRNRALTALGKLQGDELSPHKRASVWILSGPRSQPKSGHLDVKSASCQLDGTLNGRWDEKVDPDHSQR